jgi:hypothetical protein
MKGPYSGFVGNVWDHFSYEKNLHKLENNEIPLWTLDEFMKSLHYNFVTERKPLYRLSKLIENYAQDNNVSLFTTFEKVARFKFVERRYSEIINRVPKIWIVGDFDKTQFHLSPKIKVLNCRDTNLVNVWSVITRGPLGPFGLISEEFEDDNFRGFFTTDPEICDYALEMMEKTLDAKIDI